MRASGGIFGIVMIHGGLVLRRFGIQGFGTEGVAFFVVRMASWSEVEI